MPSSCASKARRPTRPLLPDPIGESRVGRPSWENLRLPSKRGRAARADSRGFARDRRGRVAVRPGRTRPLRARRQPLRGRPAGRGRASDRGRRGDGGPVRGRERDRHSRARGGDGPGGRVARAGAGHRLQPASAEDRRPGVRERDRAARGRARCGQRAVGPARSPGRGRRGGLRGVHDRRDDRPRRVGDAVAAARDDRRSRRAAPRGLRQRRGRRVGLRAVANLRRRARRLQGGGRPQAWRAGPPQRRGAGAEGLQDAHESRRLCLEPGDSARWDPPGASDRRIGGDARAGDRSHAADCRDPAGAGGGGPAVRPDRRRRLGRAPMPRRVSLGLRPLRLALAAPGPRRRAGVPRLDRRGGRGGPDR